MPEFYCSEFVYSLHGLKISSFFPQASQLKKEDLHLQSSLATNDYLKTKSLVKPTPNEPDDVLPTGFERSCSPSSSTLNKKRIPIISIDPGFTPPQVSSEQNDQMFIFP